MSNNPNYFGTDLEIMSNANNYYNWIISEFKHFIGNNIAEIGAGSGNFTEFLLKENIKKISSYEPSKNMYKILKNKFSNNKIVNIYNGYFGNSNVPQKELFDTILYINVLEHIKDDKKELLNVQKSLKPNGHVLIFVPALNWLYSDFDKKVGHYRRYNKNDLKLLLEEVGFTIKKLKYFDSIGILPWYIFSVILKLDISNSSVSTYDKLIIPFISTIEKRISPFIGKNLIAVAQKS